MVALLSALLLSLALVATPPGLSTYQHESLVAACNAGAKHGLCELTMAVVLFESSGCTRLENAKDPLSLGCGQVRQVAACELEPRYCAELMPEEEFRRRMLTDRAANLSLSAGYLARCRDFYRFTKQESMLACYSLGPGGAAALTFHQRMKHWYPAEVAERIAFIRERYGRE